MGAASGIPIVLKDNGIGGKKLAEASSISVDKLFVGGSEVQGGAGAGELSALADTTIASAPTSIQGLFFDPTLQKWVPSSVVTTTGAGGGVTSLAFSSLTDVSSNLIPVANQVLVWDGTVYTASTIGSIGGVTSLAFSSLTDVSSGILPAANQVLVWDGTTYTASTIETGSGGVNSLSALGDVNVTATPTESQVLAYTTADGGSWIASTVVTVSAASGTVPTSHSELTLTGTKTHPLLESNITSLSSVIDDLTGNVNTVSGTASTNTAAIADIVADVSTVSSTASTNSSNISVITADVTALQTDLGTAENTLADLVADVSTVSSTASTNSSNISVVTADVTAIQGSLGTAENTIADLVADVSTVSSTASTNSSNISNLTADVTGVQTGISDITADVTAIQTTVGIQTGDILGVSASVTALQTTVGTHDSDIAAVNADVTALQTTVGTHTSDISDLTTDVTALQTNISDLTVDVTAVQTNISDLTTDVTGVQTNISDLTVDVTALQTTVGTHTSDISDLNADVTALQTSVATTGGPFLPLAGGVMTGAVTGTTIVAADMKSDAATIGGVVLGTSAGVIGQVSQVLISSSTPAAGVAQDAGVMSLISVQQDGKTVPAIIYADGTIYNISLIEPEIILQDADYGADGYVPPDDQELNKIGTFNKQTIKSSFIPVIPDSSKSYDINASSRPFIVSGDIHIDGNISSTGSLSLSSDSTLTFPTMAAAIAYTEYSGQDGKFVLIDGLRGGVFVVDDPAGGTADGGTVIDVNSGSQQIIRRYEGPVRPEWWGVTGDGSTDDTSLLSSCFGSPAAIERGVEIRDGLDIRVTDTITFGGATLIMHGLSQIRYAGTMDRSVLVISPSGGSGSVIENGNYKLSVYSNSVGWGDSNYVLIDLVNLVRSTVRVDLVRTGGVGVRCLGNGTGFVFNEISFGLFNNCQTGLKLDSVSSGWCNENNFYGGAVLCSPGLNDSLDRFGWVIDSQTNYYSNNNHWWKPSFELQADNLVSGAQAVAMQVDYGQRNYAKSARLEKAATNFALVANNDSRSNLLSVGLTFTNTDIMLVGGDTPKGFNRIEYEWFVPPEPIVYESGKLASITTKYDSTSLITKGHSWRTTAGGLTKRINSGVSMTLADDHIQFIGGSLLVVPFEIDNVGVVEVEAERVEGQLGKLHLTCKDSSGTIISTPATIPITESAAASYDTDYGGGYEAGIELDGTHRWQVPSGTRYVEVGFRNFTTTLHLISWKIAFHPLDPREAFTARKEVIHGRRHEEMLIATGDPATNSSTQTHVVGDTVYDANPTATGKLGWVCVASGVPGTWKSFGSIDELSLSSLEDVADVGSATHGQLLTYNGESAIWVASAAPAAGEGGGGTVPTNLISGVFKDPSAVDVSNTTTETDIFKQTIAGGALDASGCIKVTFFGKFFNDFGNQTIRLRIYLGGTEFYEDAATIASNSQPRALYTQFMIANAGTTSTQQGAGVFFMGPAAFASTGYGDFNSSSDEQDAFGMIDGTEDTTTDKELRISIQLGSADVNLYYQHHYCLVELV